ncbi:VOC family protein [Amycolatopsis kentuckyensis]|uniref:VOC family protein n=1 Tax=Amycolatopsis kentuckyensis TaxID=218823 RepID=UPI001FC9A163|nr:VOC family protein [Amycolatopsis kentuckyensis]
MSNVRIETRILTRDLVRARRWYAEKFGLETVEEREGGLRYGGASDVFCLYTSTGASDGSCTHVDDLESMVATLRERGVVFEEYEGMRGGIMEIRDNYRARAAASGPRGSVTAKATSSGWAKWCPDHQGQLFEAEPRV